MHVNFYVHEHNAATGVDGFLWGGSCVKKFLQAVYGAEDIVELTK